jgi:hypothetical protein
MVSPLALAQVEKRMKPLTVDPFRHGGERLAAAVEAL